MTFIRRHKFNAVRTISSDGKAFPSKAEARRYEMLKLLVANGEITDLSLQPSFSLDVNGIHICKYRADFQYYDKDDNWIVEDVKGLMTDVFKIKARLMKACHNIDVQVVR